MLLSFSSVQQLVNQASEIMCQNQYQFSDFCSLFSQFNHQKASAFFNSILEEILAQKVSGRKSAYSEQVHLYSEDDFNLSLKISGEGHHETDLTICASDFELILVSLAKEPLSVPVYRTTVNPASIYDRPRPLKEPYWLTVEPCRPYLFEAYTEIADLDFADRSEPLLTIHSKSRAPVTWVFDRQTGEPLNLTDNDLQRSRIQLAVRVIGETGNASHTEILDNLARSDFDHVVRWEAAESLYNLDEEKGLSLLRESLVNDRNPALAQAAKETLENLAEETAP